MTQHDYGAHEVIELQDILTNTINSINTFQLYLQSVQDTSLRQIALNQLRFMTEEYNHLVHFVRGLATGQTISYHSFGDWTSGVNQGNNSHSITNVQTSANQPRMSDVDLASCMLTLHKAGATMRMHAALECADSNIRQMMLQGATNCAHQAYEIWGYIHAHGKYPVPSLQELSQSHLLHDFRPQQVGAQPVHSTIQHTDTTTDTPFSETVYSNGFEAPQPDDFDETSLS